MGTGKRVTWGEAGVGEDLGRRWNLTWDLEESRHLENM